MLEGKVALVTGAASGIGRAIAEIYAREGARVAVSDVADADGERFADELRANGAKAIYVHADISVAAECQALVRRTVDELGGLDVACNNAGIGGESNLVGDLSIEGWDRVIAINLSGAFYCMRYEIPAMLEHGGAIVNMASILGEVGFPTASAYVSAKHGLVGLTKNAALEYATRGIRVNSVGPAFIHTPLIAALENDRDTLAKLTAAHPIGRLGKPEEVAELVLWLSCGKSSFVTGSYYPIDGGYLAQ
ncbi:MAG: SDR family oxidoreductase [Thermoanaerobaculia bacterium]